MVDLYIFQQINQFAGKSAILDDIAIFLAVYSAYILLFLLLFLFFLNKEKRYKIIALESLISALLSRAFTELIRLIYFRPRPFVEHNVNLLFNEKLSASLPSGHSSFYFGLSFLIYFFDKKTGSFFLIVSSLMGLARIFVGVHYLSDILSGMFIGLLSAYLVRWLFKKYLIFRAKKE